MMNRRKFLKRIAAVAAGAIAIPTIAKQLPFKPNPAQQLIIGEHDRYCRWHMKRLSNPFGPNAYCAGGGVGYEYTLVRVPIKETKNVNIRRRERTERLNITRYATQP